MKSNKRISLLLAGFMLALAPLSLSAPASAQAIFASPRAATVAGMPGTYQTAPTSPGAGAFVASPNGYASANDVAADPYVAIFAQIQTAATALLAGPGALAFGVLILGLGFGVAWRLVKKGVGSIAK